MAYGTINGKTKDWSDKEINSAKGGGQFFTPASTPKQTTTRPKATTTVSTPKVTSSPIISTPKASEPENLWGKNPITSTPIQPSQVAGIGNGGGGGIKNAQPVQHNTDQQIAQFQKEYQDALSRDDIAGMIQASEKADNYRISKGQAAQNTQLIAGLKEKRTAKTNEGLKPYLDAYQQAYAKGDIQGMINSAKQADDYRQSIGEARVNDALIKDLQGRLQGGQQIGIDGNPIGQLPQMKTGVLDSDPKLAAIQQKYKDAAARGDYAGMMAAAKEADDYRLSIGQAAQNTQLLSDLQGKRQEKISTALKPYQDKYKEAYAKGDIQGMLDAAQQADDYRASIGEPRVNDSLINDLKSKLQGGQSVGGSIASQMPEFTMPKFNIPDYESKYTNVMDTLNKELINDILNPETSPYRGQIEELIKQLNDAQFSYDAGSDANLQNAIENTSRQVMEQLNRRGILNSTITQQDVSTAIANLTGQYSNLAYQRFQDTQSRQFKILDQIQQLDQAWTTDRNNRTQQVRELASYINTLDNKDYSIYKDTADQYYKQVTTQIEVRKQEIELQRQKIKDAWERVQNLGYADNKAALILGILPGTLSKDVQAEARKQQYELDQMKAELDKQLSLKQADYEVSTKLQQQRDAAENARLQYTQEQQNARTKYQEEQQKNRTYASIQASKDKAATSKTNVNSAQNDFYQEVIADMDANIGEEGKDPESAYKRLESNKDTFVQQMGADNYNKAIKHSQDLYLDLITDRWRGEYEGLKKELNSKSDYYKKVLGSSNYNKAMKLKDN